MRLIDASDFFRKAINADLILLFFLNYAPPQLVGWCTTTKRHVLGANFTLILVKRVYRLTATRKDYTTFLRRF